MKLINILNEIRVHQDLGLNWSDAKIVEVEYVGKNDELEKLFIHKYSFLISLGNKYYMYPLPPPLIFINKKYFKSSLKSFKTFKYDLLVAKSLYQKGEYKIFN